MTFSEVGIKQRFVCNDKEYIKTSSVEAIRNGRQFYLANSLTVELC